MADVTEATKQKHVPDSKKAVLITWGPVAAVVVTVGIYLLSQVFGSLAITLYVGLRHFTNTYANAWVQGAGPQFVYVMIVEALTLGMLYLFLRHRKATFKTLGLIKPKLRDLGWALIGFGVYFPILVAVMALVKVAVPQINQSQQQQLGFQSAHGPQLILVFISLVLVPPLVEEILARGFLYLGLKSKLHWFVAALITSLMFATAHLEFGSGAPLLWSAAIDTFILSWVLIWLREQTGGLWSSIGLHMLKNLVAFSALFIFVK